MNVKKNLVQRSRFLAPLVGVMLALAACSTDQTPDAATGPATFGFSVDPATQTVVLVQPSSLAPQQADAPGEARMLVQGREIILASLSAIFEDETTLVIRASFRNATDELSFLQPLFFTVNEGTENIVSSEEPTVTDDDLGGDGVLGPIEISSILTFRVQHRDERFTYLVDANAVVEAAAGTAAR